MGLGLKSFEDTFSFVKKTPKIFLLALLPTIANFIMILTTTNFIISLIMPYAFNYFTIIILFVVNFLLSIIVTGSFPIVVYQGLVIKKIDLVKALKYSLERFGKILITYIISGGIIVGIISIPLLFSILARLSNSPTLLVISLILSIPFIIVSLFISFRLFLIFPVLMLEEKRPIESIKKSWNITKGHVWSILGGILLLTLVVLVISLPIIFFGLFFNFLGFPYISIITSFITSTISLAFYGPFATILYFNIKKRLS